MLWEHPEQAVSFWKMLLGAECVCVCVLYGQGLLLLGKSLGQEWETVLVRCFHCVACVPSRRCVAKVSLGGK